MPVSTLTTKYQATVPKAIRDLESTGLPAPSIVRWKLFTLDASLIVRRAGSLGPADRAACRERQPMAI
jgi:mRNA interferase MazF